MLNRIIVYISLFVVFIIHNIASAKVPYKGDNYYQDMADIYQPAKNLKKRYPNYIKNPYDPEMPKIPKNFNENKSYFGVRLKNTNIEDATIGTIGTATVGGQKEQRNDLFNDDIINFKSGYATSLVLGGKLKYNFRVEIEAGFEQNKIDEWDNEINNTGATYASDGKFYELGLDLNKSYLRQYSAGMNLFYDINLSDAVKPYIGAGIGTERYEFHTDSIDNSGEEDYGRFYQFMTGIVLNVNKKFSVNLGYRKKKLFSKYSFNLIRDSQAVDISDTEDSDGDEVDESTVNDVDIRDIKIPYKTHIVEVGFNINF